MKGTITIAETKADAAAQRADQKTNKWQSKIVQYSLTASAK